MLLLPHSFLICSIPISYPKRRFFDIFQQKKICIVESIEFILSEDEPTCRASVYVAKWFHGKVCEKFLQQLRTHRSIDFIDDNHYVWKIMSTPKRNVSSKWFFTPESNIIKMKLNPRYGETKDTTKNATDDDLI